MHLPPPHGHGQPFAIPSEFRARLETAPLDAIEWSVRARGCLERASCQNLWDAAIRSDEEWSKVRNLGSKTLNEIKAKLCAYLAQVVANSTVAETTGGMREALSPADQELTTWASNPDPRRISQSAWAHLLIALQGSNRIHAPIGEIAAKLGVQWPAHRYAEPLSDFLMPDLGQLWGLAGLGTSKVRAIIQCALVLWAEERGMAVQALDDRTNKLASIAAALQTSSLASAMEAAFTTAGLNAKERSIFEQRYGLTGKHPFTLEDVGKNYGVTRERIRQIQAQAQEKIVRAPDLHLILKEGLTHLEPQFFERLSGSVPGFIEERPQNALLERLGSWEGLLVDLLHGTIDDWLNKRAERTALGWVYGEATQANVARATPILTTYLQRCGVPLPVAVASRETGLPETLVRIAALHGAGWLLDAFVAAQRLRSKEQRALRVHEQTRLAESPLLKRRLLPTLFHPEVREDSYSVSTFNQEVGCFPKLLMRCGSEHVLRITPPWEVKHPDVRPHLPANVFRARSEEEESPDGANVEEDSLYAFGFRLLQTRKLWRVRELMEQLATTSQGRFAATSIGALLVSHRVQRFAPGLWGMKETVLLESDDELLLQPEDCKLYVEARHAQTDLSPFPMWTPRMEFRWCRWAREQAKHADIYQSLLSVIAPDEWNCPSPLREQWKKRQRENGRYRFSHPPRKALAQLPVVADELLAAVGAVVGRGGTSWMDLNIAHGRTMDSHRSAPYLALLIALEAVEPEEHWQDFHPATPKARDRFQQLCSLWCEGSPDGSQAVIEETRLAAQKHEQLRRGIGWVGADELESLLSILGSTATLAHESEVVE